MLEKRIPYYGFSISFAAFVTGLDVFEHGDPAYPNRDQYSYAADAAASIIQTKFVPDETEKSIENGVLQFDLEE